MELRQLRYFVAVAEELSFTRAAAQIPIAVGALSVQIRRLERELGGPLFLRTTHSVELTSAGTALLPIAREVLARVDGVPEVLRRVASATQLVVAIVDEGLAEITGPVLAEHRRRHPLVSVTVQPMQRAQLLDPNASVDAVLWVHDVPPTPAWRFEPVVCCDPVAVVAASHPLASRTSVRADELVDQVFVRVPEPARAWHRRHHLDDVRGGPPARFSDIEVSDVSAGQTVLALSDAVIVQPSSKLRYMARADVRGIPIDGLAPFPLGIAWRSSDVRVEIADLLETAHEVASAHILPAGMVVVGPPDGAASRR